MKLTILQENLIKALTNASRIITTKAQMPVLGHVKLEASKSGLTLSATDLEIGLKLQVGAKVEKPGTLTVPSRMITELIGNTGPGTLELSAAGHELAIKGSGLKATLSGMSADEFPALPEFSPHQDGAGRVMELPTEQLVAAIGKVAFTAATDDSRPVLTAIQMKTMDGNLELAATDGFRLSWIRLTPPRPPLSKEGKKEIEWLIPARALQEVTRLIDPSVKAIQLGLTDKANQVIFQIGDTQLISRLVSGDFPNIQKVMPSTGDTVVELDRQELLRAMRLAAIFARESANIVKFDVKPGQLIIAANAPQVGGQESTIDAKVDGPAMQIAFNYRFVLDYLNCGTSPVVQLLMTTSLGPGLWLEAGSGAEKQKSPQAEIEFKHVIMPVRVENSTSE